MLYADERRSLNGVIDDLIKFRLVDCTGGMLAVRCNADHLMFSVSGGGFRRWHTGLEDFIVTDNSATSSSSTNARRPPDF